MTLNNLFNQNRLDQYAAYLKSSGLSDASFKRKLSSLTSFQKFLVKNNLIEPSVETLHATFLPTNTLKAKPNLKSVFNNLKSKFHLTSENRNLKSNFILRYVAIFSLFVIGLGLGFTLYRQAFTQSTKNFAYTTASNPTIANRQLSFQGRLTDSSGNPITSSTTILFKLYDTETVGTGNSLYTSATGNSQTVVPDENGIFSVVIGKTHGTEIPDSVFTQNSAVYLEITAGGETMSPRQPIATVAYALNSETLQGLPPSASGLKNTVLVIDELGNINLGETSPTIKSTSGTLGIEAQAVLIKATDGSGGNIEINPDANGIIKLTTEGSGSTLVGGFINATNANLATGNLFNATINNTNRGYKFINFSNYNVGTTQLSSRFSVDAYGNTNVGGTLSTTNLTVGSSSLVSNLNADLLDGLHSSNFVGVGQTSAFVYSASNGLSLASNTFKLGGLLTQNTDIGLSGFSLSFSDGGSTLVSFSSTGNTFYNPTSFLSGGDVSMAYNLNFTNSSGSSINTAGPFALNAGEVFGSSNLTLKTYNAGNIIFDSNNVLTLGNLTIGSSLVSVGSSNMVTNLNADLLDGLHASQLLNVGATGNFLTDITAGVGISVSGTASNRTVSVDYGAGIGTSGNKIINTGIINASNGTLTRSGSDGSYTLGINLNNTNNWTGAQNFASSVGVGTTSPSAALEIITSGNAALKVSGGYIDLPTATKLSSELVDDLLLYLPLQSSIASSRGNPGTFTRTDTTSGSSSTYTGDSGYITYDYIYTNVPRFERTSIGRGMWIENGRRNLLQYQSFENGGSISGWTNSGLETFTTNNVIRKHQGYTAQLADTNSTGGQAYRTQALTSGQSYPFYCYALNVGNTRAIIDSSVVSLYANGVVSTSYTEVDGGWYRISGTVTGTGANVNYGVSLGSNQSIYLDACQIESDYNTTNGVPYATTMIYNDSTNQRNRGEESLYFYAWRGNGSIQSTNNIINSNKGTVSLWFRPEWAASQPTTDLYFFQVPNVIQTFFQASSDSIVTQIYNGSNWTTVSVASAAQTFSAYSDHHLAVSWNNTTGVSLTLDGVKTNYSGSWTDQKAQIGFNTIFYVGSKSTTGGRIDALVSDFAIFKENLSDSNTLQIYKSKAPIEDYQRSDLIVLQQNNSSYQRGNITITGTVNSGGIGTGSISTTLLSSNYFGVNNAANITSHTIFHLPFEGSLDGSRKEVATFSRPDSVSPAATVGDEITLKLINKNANEARIDRGFISTGVNEDTQNSTGNYGIHIEDSRKNIALNSSFESMVGWTGNGTVAFTQSTAKSYHGTYAANLTSTAATRFFQTINLSSVAVGTTHQVSAYVYRNETNAWGATVDTSVAQLYARTDDSTTALGTTYTSMGNGWYRLTAEFSSTALATWDVGIQLPSSGRNVYVDAFQIERLSNDTSARFPTTYIPTNGSTVTRAAESLSYALPSSFKSEKGSFSLWFKPQWTRAIGADTTDKYLFYIPNAYRARLDATNDRFVFEAYNGTVWTTAYTNFGTADVTRYNWNHIACGWYYNYMYCRLNGNAYASSTAWTPQTPSENKIYIGSDNTGANQANAEIAAFTLFDNQLNSNQLQQLWLNRGKFEDYYRTDVARLVANGSTSALEGSFYLNGNFRSGNGTAALPSFSFNTDSDTGMYTPSANSLAFSVGGTNALTLNSTGAIISKNLSVGGTLTLPQGASDGYILTSDAAGNSYWALNTGIGTTYAAGNGLTLTSNVFSLNLGSTNVWTALQTFNNGIGVSGTTNLTNALNVGGSLSVTGKSTFSDHIGVGTAADVNWAMKIQDQYAWTALSSGGVAKFELYTDLGNMEILNGTKIRGFSDTGTTQKFQLDSATGNAYMLGNVGIGNTNPSQKLTINSGNILLSDNWGMLWDASANTQLLASAADGFKFSTGGTEKFRITAGGNVGIGTTNPAAKLEISGGASATSILNITRSDGGTQDNTWSTRISSLWGGIDKSLFLNPSTTADLALGGSSGSIPQIIIKGTSGNVGIGTTNPTRKLDVIGDASISTNLSIGGTFLSVGSTNTVTNLSADLLDGLHSSQFLQIGTSANFISNITAGTDISITGSGIGRTINDTSTLSSVTGRGASTSTLLSLLGGAYFGSTSQSILKNDGSVGIGTTNPFGKLHLIVPSGTGSASDQQFYVSDNNTNAQEMRIGVNTPGLYSYIQSTQRNVASANLSLNPNGGNVGIGTTNPTYKLDVAGIFRSSSTSNSIFGDGSTGGVQLGDGTISKTSGSYFQVSSGMKLSNMLQVSTGGIGVTGNINLNNGSIKTNGYLLSDASTDNLLFNGDFEQGVYGWSGITSINTGTSNSYSGNNAAQFNGSITFLSDDYIPVDPYYDVFQLEAYVKKLSVGTTTGILYFGYQAFDINKTIINSAPCGSYCYFAASGLTIANDNNWHKVSATSTGEGTVYPNFPVGTRFVRVLGLVNYGGSSDSQTLIDHVTLKRINHGPLFVGNNFSSNNMVDQQQVSKIFTNSNNQLTLTAPTSGTIVLSNGTTISSNLSIGGTLTLPQGASNGYILTSDASGNAKWLANTGTGTTYAAGVGLTLSASNVFSVDYDSTLDLASNKIGLNLGNANTWTATQTFNAGNALNVGGTAVFNNLVGIGTASPTEKLTLGTGLFKINKANSVDNDSPSITTFSDDDFAYNGLYLSHYGLGFHDTNTTPGQTGAYMSGYFGLDFFTTGTNRLNINTSGNVGIGTTNPTSKLTIAGNGNFTTSLSVGTSLYIGSIGITTDNNKVLTNTNGVVQYINTSSWDKSSADDYSSWTLQANGANGTNIGNTAVVNFIGGSNVSLSKTGNAITINSTKSTYTASNGLSLVGSDFRLGGLLSQNTDIGLSGFSLSFSDGGSTLVTFSSAGNTFYNPTTFTSSGDVSMAYDLIFTNSTASYIRSQAPLYIQTESPYANLDINLTAANAGQIYLNSDAQLTKNLTVGGTFVSVGSTNTVTNLSADLLDGYHASSFLNIGSTGNLPYVNAATNGTLTRSGTGPYTLGLNLGNANTWTGAQTFGNISVGGTFLSVGSTNLVTNLNANYLNGKADTAFVGIGQTGNFITNLSVGGSGLSISGSGIGRTLTNTGLVGVSNTTLTRLGSNGTYTVGLNLANANTWTGAQTFGNISVGGTFLSVGSTNLVTNLNANYLNGFTSNSFLKTENYFYNNQDVGAIENATPQYWILTRNAADNDVNGQIRVDRTSGNSQAASIDIVITSNTAAVLGGSLITNQYTQDSENYELVTLTLNSDSNSYVALKYSGNSYPKTISRFTGYLKSTGSNSFVAVDNTLVTNVASLPTINSKHTFTGNVGIGTTNPTSKLTVVGNGSFSTNLNVGGTLTLPQGASNGYILTSDASGNAKWLANTGTGTTYAAGVGLTLSASNVFSVDYDSTLDLASNKIGLNLGNANTWTATQTFNAGNALNVGGTAVFNNLVGIGTASPHFQTEIYGIPQLTANLTDAGVRTAMLSLNGNDSSYGSGGALVFGNNQSNAANSIGWAAIKGFLTNGSGNTTGDLAFSTRNSTSDTNLTERMRINSSGNVGIGTTNPTHKLDVVGDGYFSTNLTIGGTFVSVGSTNLVTNLNADLLDGIHSSGFVGIGQTGSLPYVNAATNGTLTRSGTGPYTLGLNLGNANTWTGIQNLSAGATVSTLTATGNITTTGTFYAPSFENYRINGSMTNKSLGIDINQVAQAPMADILWHDILSFNKMDIPVFETTTDGSIWTAGTLNNNLFAHKENQAINVINSAIGTTGARWTWDAGISWSSASWLVLANTYTNPVANVTVTVESSTDGLTWTQKHLSTFNTGTGPRWLYVSDFAGDSRLRLTIISNNGNNVNLSSIQLLTSRWGDQGLGSEISYPYSWDGNQNVTFSKNLTVGGTFVSVGSQNLVSNLNSDLLDGVHSSGFVGIGQTGNFITNLSVGASGLSISGSGIGRTLTNTGLVGVSNTTLTRLGSNGTYTVGLNLANANTWTALQTFANASVGGTLTMTGTNVGTGTTALFIDASGTVTKRALGSMAFDSGTYDNYNNWKLTTNGAGSTNVLTGNTVNFVNGIGVSLSQSGSTITINNTGTGTTYAAGVGLTLSASNVFSVDYDSTLDLASNKIGLNLGNANTWTATQTFNAGIGVSGLATFANNVGIGTTNPLSKLSVGGTGITGVGIYGYGSSYGIYGDNGSNSNAGVYGKSAGYGIIGDSSGIGYAGIYGANYSISGIGVLGSAGPSGFDFYGNDRSYFGTNVAIGTTDTTHNLEVVGDAYFSTNLSIGGTFLSVGSTNLVTNLNADLLDGIHSSGFVGIGQTGSLPYVNAATNGTLTRSGTGPYTLGLNLGNANIWTATQTFNAGIGVSGLTTFANNVGIGTTNPAYKLTINSTSNLESGSLSSELLNSSNWTLGAGWGGDFASGFNHTTGNTATLTNSLAAVINSYYQITYTVTNRTAGFVNLSFGGQSQSSVASSGNFGPRATTTDYLTITPTTDFNGTISVSIKSISNYSPTFVLNDSTNTSSFEIRNSLASLNNTFVGKNAGAKNTTGNYNSAYGVQALSANTSGTYNSAQGFQALYLNTTGTFNSAQGTSSLYNNTAGNYNTAQGHASLNANITGNYNTAQGYFSLSGNTIGNYNSSLGVQALNTNTTGNYNSAIGYNAGRLLANGSTGNTSPDYSLYLGPNTKSGDSIGNAQNEIVIGYNAIGNGSNSATLGNDSITKTILKGNVGIGTTNPLYTLEIGGTGSLKVGGDLYASKLYDNDNNLYALDPANAGSSNSSLSLTTSGSIRFNYNNDGTHIITSSASKIQNFTNGLLFGVSSSTSGTVTGWDNNLFLATSGDVGIGTTDSESSRLHIYDSAKSARINLQTADVRSYITNGYDYLSFVIGNSELYLNRATGNVGIGSGNNNPSQKLDVVGNAVFSGNVGIGTTNPNAKLTVAGNIYPSTNLTYDIGSSAYRWNDAWIKTVNIGSSTWSLQSPDNSRFSLFNSAVGGTEAMTILASGNVGIGTIGPKTKLQVSSSNASDTFTLGGASGGFTVSNANDAYGITMGVLNSGHGWIQSGRVDGTATPYNLYLQPGGGKVGIGTTDPLYPLDVIGDASIDNILHLGTYATLHGDSAFLNIAVGTTADSNTYGRGIILRVATDNSSWGNIGMSTSSVLSFGAGKAVGSGLNLLSINSSGNVGIGTTDPTRKLQVEGTGYFSSTIEIGSSMSITTASFRGSTLDSAATPGFSWEADTNTGFFNAAADSIGFSTGGTERMRLKSTGLGIGTTNPAQAFHVYKDNGSTAGMAYPLRIDSKTTAAGNINGTGLEFFWYARSTGAIETMRTNLAGGYGTDMIFKTNNPGTSTGLTANLTERMRLNANGNVGIGDSTPGEKLQVAGNIRLGTANSGVNDNADYYISTGGQLHIAANDNGTDNSYSNLFLSAGVAGGSTLGVDPSVRIATQGVERLIVNNNGVVSMPYGHGDLAENYLIDGTALRGSIVSIGSTNPSTAITSSKKSQSLLGVISTAPGAVMDVDGGYQIGGETKGVYQNEKAPIALTGAVPVLVVSTNGPINLSDSINASEISGFGAKATTAGQIVGKALEAFNPTDSTCTTVSSFESISWPDDDGKNSLHPCYKLPNGTYVGKIMAFISASWYDPDVQITATGDINVNYNISDSVLASLGYNDSKNEIETATYKLTDSTGRIIDRLGQFSEIASAKIKTGLLSATNIVTKNLISEKTITRELVSPKANIDQLTATDIQTTSITTDELTTDNLTANEATISTLYADNIISKEGSFGDLMAQKVSAVRDELKKLIEDKESSSSAITGTSIASQTSDWRMNIASDSAQITGDLAITNNLVIGAKLLVNGDTQLANAFITGTFSAGEISIKDNFIETTNTALYIQPSNTGSIHMMGETLVIAENGEVQINGNLAVSGSLFANLITANEVQTQKLTAVEINSDQVKIATDSAQVIIAESGFAALATSSANLTSNATAGTATLPAGKTEIIINNNKITNNSMVYITPVGSTKNQVPYIKAKVISESESYFTIALDNPLDQDIEINWWIIN